MKIATCTLIAHTYGYVKGALAQIIAIKELCPDISDNYIIVEQGHYSDVIYQQLEKLGYKLLIRHPIRPNYKAKYVASRWKHTFNKFYILSELTDYDRVIFLDADCLPVEPNFHLGMIDLQGHQLSASRVNRHSTARFNSGVMCIQPTIEAYNRAIEILNTDPQAARLGDQGVLNIAFPSFRLLSDRYNVRNWTTRIISDAIIAHLRPTPWNASRPPKGGLYYYNLWLNRYEQALNKL